MAGAPAGGVLRARNSDADDKEYGQVSGRRGESYGSETVRHERRSADGFFQYYRGPLNLLMYEFEDDNLERLKQRIASREAPIALTY